MLPAISQVWSWKCWILLGQLIISFLGQKLYPLYVKWTWFSACLPLEVCHRTDTSLLQWRKQLNEGNPWPILKVFNKSSLHIIYYLTAFNIPVNPMDGMCRKTGMEVFKFFCPVVNFRLGHYYKFNHTLYWSLLSSNLRSECKKSLHSSP